MKAQLFIVTMIFLVGLVFSVQQLLFQYSSLDLSAVYRENDIYLIRNIKDTINSTIKRTPECTDFSQKMEELNSFFDSEPPIGGYALSLDYTLDCGCWDKRPPACPPLNLSIRITGRGSETTQRLAMYHM